MHICRVAEAVVRAIGSKWPVRMGLLPFVPEALQAQKQTGTTHSYLLSLKAIFLMFGVMPTLDSDGHLWHSCHGSCTLTHVQAFYTVSVTNQSWYAGSTTTAKQVASVSAQAAQALHMLDSSFGSSACLYFLSQLQPSDPYASSSSGSSEPSTLTMPQVCWQACCVTRQHVAHYC